MKDEEVVDAVLAEESVRSTEQPKKEKKESALKRLWNATIFPDMIREMKAKKAREREAKAKMKELQHEARLEAMEELKPALKEKLKEKELKKLTGEDKKEKLQKFADAFSMKGMGGGKDIGAMMGAGSSGGMSNEDIARNLGGRDTSMPSSTHPGGGMSNDDIARAMGGGPGMSGRDITGMSSFGNEPEPEPEPKKKRGRPKKKVEPQPQPRQKTPGEEANERLARMLGR